MEDFSAAFIFLIVLGTIGYLIYLFIVLYRHDPESGSSNSTRESSGVSPIANHIETPFEFEGSPDNDKRVIVSECTEEQLRTVLDEFAKLYMMTEWVVDGFIVTRTGGGFEIRFPRDVPPDIFTYLVNFIRYPIGSKGIKNVFGVSTLGADFRTLRCPVQDIRAVFYVPDPDPRGDIVRVLTETGGCWDHTFERSNKWIPAKSRFTFEDFDSAVDSLWS